MIIEPHQIIVSGLSVEVVRKAIKNLHLGVYPPHGCVRVAAPLAVNDDAIRLAVVTRLGWIKKQQTKFTTQARQTPREYVTGETHYFQGQRYRLNVVHQEGRSHVAIRNKSIIDLFVNKSADKTQREKIFQVWYRQQIKLLVPDLLAKWETVIGVKAAEWGIKQMKTKWGTCNTQSKRIWLNLELIKKPVACLEYIIVHELVHLLEKNHNDYFITHMDAFMPLWRLRREELNRSILGHSDWGLSVTQCTK
jgi:predicted metal-dependent hydrolase